MDKSAGRKSVLAGDYFVFELSRVHIVYRESC